VRHGAKPGGHSEITDLEETKARIVPVLEARGNDLDAEHRSFCDSYIRAANGRGAPINISGLT